MVSFDYLEPESLDEAHALLERHGEQAKLIAGGTALLIWMRMRLLNPRFMVSLARVPGLDAIRYDPATGLTIGACARHRDIELDPAVRQRYPLLHETFRKVAQPRIRNMGTVGGNLCQGDPLTDPGAGLIALGAEVALSRRGGERIVPVESFFLDYYQTDLRPGEILTEIRVPPPGASLGWSHIKFTPRSLEDFATVGVALALTARGARCENIRLALNSVGPTIFRAKKAEEILRGQRLDEETVRAAGEAAAAQADPMDDNRGSAEYKRELVKVLVARAIAEARERPGSRP